MANGDDTLIHWALGSMTVALSSVLGWLGMNAMRRIQTLEANQTTKQDLEAAARDRAEIRDSINRLSDTVTENHNFIVKELLRLGRHNDVG